MPRGRFLLLSLVALALAFTGRARAVPPLPPGGIGVNVHFVNPQPGEMEMLAATGIKWVRMDAEWRYIEQKKGVYNFTGVEQFLAALDKKGIHAILILDYGNPLYAQPREPEPYTSKAGTPEFRDAYCAWAAALVSHFAGRGCIWEIWNEPNLSGFWKPDPRPDQYVSLAKAACAAIHKAAPNEPLIGPGCSRIDLNFLETCFKGGLLEEWSAVSVHPYRAAGPETVAAEYQKLRDLLAKYAPAGRTIPIISSEWGYSVKKDRDENLQADLLTRELAVNAKCGIALSIWYEWRDDGEDPNNLEFNYGLVRRRYHHNRNPVYDPKPAYFALKKVTAQPPAAQ